MALKNVYSINVDIKYRMTSIVPTFSQGDSGILKFRVYDNGRLMDLSNYTRSEVAFKLPSGRVLIGDAELVNGEIVYTFTGLEMNEVGKLETVLSIKSGTDTVSIQPFYCFIFDSMRSNTLEYVGILQELIKEVQGLESNIGELLNNFESFEYDASTTYNFPNFVLYDSSTYIALKEVRGITPTNDGINYRLAIRKGADGQGTVSSINGVSPDEEGNVELDIVPGVENHINNMDTQKHIKVVYDVPSNLDDSGILIKVDGSQSDVPGMITVDELNKSITQKVQAAKDETLIQVTEQMEHNIGEKPQSSSNDLTVWDDLKERSVNVKWFGAKGDGTTDDTVAIQAAIDSVPTNVSLVVIFPAGVFCYKQLTVPKNVTLKGHVPVVMSHGVIPPSYLKRLVDNTVAVGIECHGVIKDLNHIDLNLTTGTSVKSYNRIENVSFLDGYNALEIYEDSSIHDSIFRYYDKIYVRKSRGDAFTINGLADARISNVEANGCHGNGYVFKGSCGTINLINGKAAWCWNNSILFDGYNTEITFDNFIIDGANWFNVRINATTQNLKFVGCNFIGGLWLGNDRPPLPDALGAGINTQVLINTNYVSIDFVGCFFRTNNQPNRWTTNDRIDSVIGATSTLTLQGAYVTFIGCNNRQYSSTNLKHLLKDEYNVNSFVKLRSIGTDIFNGVFMSQGLDFGFQSYKTQTEIQAYGTTLKRGATVWDGTNNIGLYHRGSGNWFDSAGKQHYANGVFTGYAIRGTEIKQYTQPEIQALDYTKLEPRTVIWDFTNSLLLYHRGSGNFFGSNGRQYYTNGVFSAHQIRGEAVPRYTEAEIGAFVATNVQPYIQIWDNTHNVMLFYKQNGNWDDLSGNRIYTNGVYVGYQVKGDEILRYTETEIGAFAVNNIKPYIQIWDSTHSVMLFYIQNGNWNDLMGNRRYTNGVYVYTS